MELTSRPNASSTTPWTASEHPHAENDQTTAAGSGRIPVSTANPDPERGRAPFSDASPTQVRAALIPEEAAEFDRQWREVMATATESLDLTEVLQTLQSWRRVAWLTASAGAEAHRRMYRQAAARLTGTEIPRDEPLTRTKARLGHL